MTEQKFWEIIEMAWADSPELDKQRAKALESNDEETLEELSEALESTILENYDKRLLALDKENFTKFIHLLEERLYHIDREEIHEYTDGSETAFYMAAVSYLAWDNNITIWWTVNLQKQPLTWRPNRLDFRHMNSMKKNLEKSLTDILSIVLNPAQTKTDGNKHKNPSIKPSQKW